MAEELEAVLKKNEKGPLDKFKNESLIYKQFGEDGVRAYSAINAGTKVRELLAHLGMNEQKLIELLEFMDTHGIIMVEHPGMAVAAIPSPASLRTAEAAREIVTEIAQRESEILPPAKPVLPALPPELPRAPEYGRPPEMPAPPPSLRAEPRPAEPELPTSTLSPLEKTIYQKFGRIGLTVYDLIDGEKTAEEILNETGISEVKLVEILEFMDKEGIIRLEKPAEEKPAEAEKPRPRFEPMLEEKREAEETIESDAIPIDLPIRHSQGAIKDLLLQAELFIRFPSFGNKCYSEMDGQHDEVQLAAATGAPLEKLDSLLAFLGTRGAALMRPLKPKEVRAKYGDDGLAIYKKYGRDGMLVYELIGKEGSVRDIVQKSKMDKNRAVDIFIYIHKVLGLELPVDRQTLLRQIG